MRARRFRVSETLSTTGLLLVASVSLAFSATLARAQQSVPERLPSADVRAEARLHFEQGTAAFQAGRLEEACAHFDAAAARVVTPATVSNASLCWERAGSPARALEALFRADALGPELEQRRDSLSSEVGWVRVEAPAGVSQVRIDGELVEDAGATHPLDAGDHTLSYVRAGESLSERFALVRGEQRVLRLTDTAPATAEAPTTTPSATSTPTVVAGPVTAGPVTAGPTPQPAAVVSTSSETVARTPMTTFAIPASAAPLLDATSVRDDTALHWLLVLGVGALAVGGTALAVSLVPTDANPAAPHVRIATLTF